ncbi:MAG: phosphoglucomutase [Marinilabiliales bacterium]|nr:MAG: phosphoglucomutase [Marinilabiliales bacterium]
MMNTKIDENVMNKANIWLEGNYDEETKKTIKDLIENNPDEIIESFYRDLEFGTGGLRGIMGVGSNRMNKYTVGSATQGFSNYLRKNFPDLNQIKVAIAFDSRNNSKYFAQITADVFSANGIKVFLFENLKPTPELSFAIRHFGCQGGIVITASHNPKEYNGYKAYCDDGGQIISPHDKNIIEEVNNINDIDEVNFNGNPELIQILNDDFDKIYIENIKSLSLSPEIIAKQNDLNIVFTPIHGTGVKLVPEVLKEFGFKNVHTVEEQSEKFGNGDFPTVKSPNPEESAALHLAIEKAKNIGGELVMATDPDSDRVGIAVKNGDDFILLNGNQAATLLINYLLTKWNENGKLKGKEFIVKTIVTSELLIDLANKYSVKHYDVLTGFKYIADIIKRLEGKEDFIGGGEESYGYLVGDFVRDKDAVISCAMIAETAAWAKNNGIGMLDLLKEIYVEHGFYKEKLISVVRKGKSGAEEIQSIMAGFRNNPPKEMGGSKIITIKDYQKSQTIDLVNNTTTTIDLPKSNVLQFFTEDGSKVSVRPSGTEPKIKFYFGLKGTLKSIDEYDEINTELQSRIDNIVKELGL